MTVLVVPVRLNVLLAPTDLDVDGPSADFRRLPYVDPDSGRDVGSDVPYVSEVVLPAPFEGEQLRLRAGVHLHWSLPDSLTRLVQTAAGTEIPLVPDRWLVTRHRAGVLERQWVVESDFLAEVDTGGVPYPVDTPGRPYRFLGRAVPLGAWDPAAGRASRLPGLTAVGYGEPTFAAFYPNCRGVFGLHDPDVVGVPDAGLGYDVLGWYADRGDDELVRVLAAADTDTSTGTGTDGNWADVLAERLAWSAAAGGAAPDRLVCFAALTFGEPAADPASVSTLDVDGAGVWVANTATEALAAHLGAAVPGASPDGAENLLEALTHADELEAATVDLPLRLAAARHRTSFASVPGGTEWTVRRQDDPAATPAERQAREAIVLPPELDAALAELNGLQWALDRALAELTGLRQRLAVDWYRYVLCAYPPDGVRDSYPDPDEVAGYLRRGVDRVTELSRQVGQTPAADPAAMLAGRVAAARDAVATRLVPVNVTAAAARSSYVLQGAPAQPYRQPNDPVVLLTGSAARPSERFGADAGPDGTLGCAVVDAAADATAGPDAVTALRARVAAAADPALDRARQTWTRPSWDPVLLRWEVEFFPAGLGNNLDPDDRDYDPEFITANYDLAPADVELRLRPGREVQDKAANVYAGSTVLSAGAWPVLADRVLRYLEGALLDPGDATLPPGRPTCGSAEFQADPGPVLDWYAAAGTDERLLTLIRVYRHLTGNEDRNLAQSLGGFADALLMLRLVRQLPIADPLGFPSGQALAAEVAAAVAGQSRHAPQPLTDFNPIRAGSLWVRRLRIVDTFGVRHDVPTDQPHTATGLRLPDHPDWVALPPRLTQPARLVVRLLDARADGRPVTGLPTSSPVCGWLLPEFLDDSIQVHAADGRRLGQLRGDLAADDPAVWRAAPGAPATALTDIDNARLRAVVARLAASGTDGVGGFLDTLDDGLAGVEPEGLISPTVRTVLFGRPLAVVRLSIRLELLGPAAVSQDWNVFRQDLARPGRESNAFERVRFPVRVGEHGRLGDGVLGYWLEDASGTLGPRFHDVAGLAQEEAEIPVAVTAAGRTVRLTLLVDPHGPIHVTSGVLPVETVQVAAEHFAAALDRLEVGFLAAPVLTDADRVTVPVPAEPGVTWLWREPTRSGWTRTPVAAGDTTSSPAIPTLREGWLTLPAPAPPASAEDTTQEGS
ncbi:hypothetical protein [Parafrankia discariae]|uniref:hypothetical protein n=1 Tax=Parafrankia discariae TaxID=365528 RepID=UPI0003608AC4|nr:hypothetical protein [Parafrankia discariae]